MRVSGSWFIANWTDSEVAYVWAVALGIEVANKNRNNKTMKGEKFCIETGHDGIKIENFKLVKKMLLLKWQYMYSIYMHPKQVGSGYGKPGRRRSDSLNILGKN